jgi:hypothetical protein
MRLQQIILIPIILMLFGCSSESGGDHKLPPGMHSVKYEVYTSTQDTTILYRDENGYDQEITNVNTHDKPWIYTFNAAGGTHLNLSARLLGDGIDTIYVTIYIDHLEGFQEHSYGTGVSAGRTYDIPLTD